jgi:hypothetical protein
MADEKSNATECLQYGCQWSNCCEEIKRSGEVINMLKAKFYTPQMTEVPDRSSGALWTPEEDEHLYQAVHALTAQFPGRSIAAVLTRIARLAPIWRRQQ